MAPFIEAWKPEVEQLDRPRWPGSVGRNLSEALVRGDNSAIERALKEAIQAETGKGAGRVFVELLKQMIMALRKVVHIATADKVSYLNPIVDLARRAGTLAVATLNYDRSIELACEAAEVPLETGIASWSRSGRLEPPSAGVYLLKLHGSVDWRVEMKHPPASGTAMAQTVVEVTDDPLNDSRTPALIFGQRGKLRSQGPFLELLAEFDRALRSATQLVAVGYSFRDEHVNELIRSWINGGSRRHLTVVDPDFPRAGGMYVPGFRGELRRLVPIDPPRGDETERRLTVVCEFAEEALPNVLGRFS